MENTLTEKLLGKRILLKLSGEQFAGDNAFGIDADFIGELAKELKEVVTKTKSQIVIVVGGGNLLRGAALSKANRTIERATADYMGMLATLMNGMALVDTLKYYGQPARLQTKVPVNVVAEPFIRLRAIRHLEKERVVIIAGGTGNPYVTTDTAAISIALELDCSVVLKATKVDGIYTADPKKDPTAQKIKSLSYLEALNDPNIKVMDNSALSLAMDHSIPIIVFDLLSYGNMLRVIEGEDIGTRVG